MGESEGHLDYPSALLSLEQRRYGGGIVLHIVLATYTCYALALICENYFVPSLHLFVKCLGLTNDIGGATLMAFGSSAPGLFLSIIGTFVTADDLGLGDIMGSCIFNICVIIGVCGLLVKQPLALDWWPITRDCLFYIVCLCMLAVVVIDSKVYWFETAIMSTAYLLYILTLYYDKSLNALAKRGIQFMRKVEDVPGDPAPGSNMNGYLQAVATITIDIGGEEMQKQTPQQLQELDPQNEPVGNRVSAPVKHEGLMSLSMPSDSVLRKILWVLALPITLVCYVCIIDCRQEKKRKFFVATFIVSIIFIALLTYIVSWMVTIIGMTFNIRDAIMGYTALAIGTSMPDLICSLTVARQGHGNMALSNGIGSNILDILINLSLPWFIRTVLPSNTHYVALSVQGIMSTIIFMVVSVVVIYLLFVWGQFRLNRKMGAASLFIYGIFLVTTVLMTLHVYKETRSAVHDIVPSATTART